MKQLNLLMAPLVIPSSPLRLHPPSASSRVCSLSLSSQLRPPPRLCPSSLRRLRSLSPPPSPPSRRFSPLSPPLQFHPPPGPQPRSSPLVSLEARSPPEPPDPPDPPFDLVHLLFLNTAFSQQFSETLNWKSPLLNLTLVVSDDVVSLCWCADWFPHRFFPSKFRYPPLPLINLVVLWQLNGLMRHTSIHHVNWVLLNVYCPVYSVMEFVLFPISSSTLCGFGAGNVLLKIRDTSNIEVLIKGFLAMLKIVDCALVAASVSEFTSLIVVFNFQGVIPLYSSMLVV
ncbi:unnamed protein product [Eruca vesicaria subsp. sativa]|uniref:Uncharacterized protein n=1 Tax=Eruca vesicaria subsp. sativa TaxID=29727 RepID=A0ABC8IZP8_ERUVS|nr:unnamed protein product [Eruca vesicaria subsp. sativa]